MIIHQQHARSRHYDDCLLDKVTENLYRCRYCGWEDNVISRRNCPKSPGGKEAARINTLSVIERAAKEQTDWHCYEIRTPEQIEPLLAVCLDCEDHPCTKQCTWLKRLACVGFRECERWATAGV